MFDQCLWALLNMLCCELCDRDMARLYSDPMSTFEGDGSQGQGTGAVECRCPNEPCLASSARFRSASRDRAMRPVVWWIRLTPMPRTAAVQPKSKIYELLQVVNCLTQSWV